MTGMRELTIDELDAVAGGGEIWSHIILPPISGPSQPTVERPPQPSNPDGPSPSTGSGTTTGLPSAPFSPVMITFPG